MTQTYKRIITTQGKVVVDENSKIEKKRLDNMY